jgi:hypothetical protein
MTVFYDASLFARGFSLYLNDGTQVDIDAKGQSKVDLFFTPAQAVAKIVGFKSNSGDNVVSLTLLGVSASCVGKLSTTEVAGIVYLSTPSISNITVLEPVIPTEAIFQGSCYLKDNQQFTGAGGDL